ncbi:MAG: hypothetical protein ABFD90_07105 [Phycisphaerales bacterium]
MRVPYAWSFDADGTGIREKWQDAAAKSDLPQARNSKLEIRNKSKAGNPNDRNVDTRLTVRFEFGISVIRACFEFRISDLPWFPDPGADSVDNAGLFW